MVPLALDCQRPAAKLSSRGDGLREKECASSAHAVPCAGCERWMIAQWPKQLRREDQGDQLAAMHVVLDRSVKENELL